MHLLLIMSLLHLLRAQENYNLFHTLYLSSPSSHGIQLTSDDEYLLVAMNDFSVKVYARTKDTFQPIQTLTQPTDNIEDIDATADHQWVVISCWDTFTYVYRLEGRKFILHQKIVNPDDRRDYSVGITDDHQVLAIGTDSQVDMYTFNHDNFTWSYSLNQPSQYVYSLSFSPDSQYLYVGDHSRNIYIYQSSNSSQYNYSHRIQFDKVDYHLVEVSRDGKVMLVSGQNGGICDVFALDGGKLTKQQQIEVDRPMGRPSLSGDGKWLALGGRGGGYLYRKGNNGYEHVQTIEGDDEVEYWHHVKMGETGEQVIAVVNNEVQIYLAESICETGQFITTLQCFQTKIILGVGVGVAILALAFVTVMLVNRCYKWKGTGKEEGLPEKSAKELEKIDEIVSSKDTGSMTDKDLG